MSALDTMPSIDRHAASRSQFGRSAYALAAPAVAQYMRSLGCLSFAELETGPDLLADSLLTQQREATLTLAAYILSRCGANSPSSTVAESSGSTRSTATAILDHLYKHVPHDVGRGAERLVAESGQGAATMQALTRALSAVFADKARWYRKQRIEAANRRELGSVPINF